MAITKNARVKILEDAQVRIKPVPLASNLTILAEQIEDLPEGSKLCLLRADSQAFQIPKTGSTSPAQIKFTPFIRGMAGTPTWEVISGTATLTDGAGADAGSKILAAAGLTTDTAQIRITVVDGVDTYTDTVTVLKVREGIDTINAYLTNESHNLPAASDGTVSSFTGAASRIYIFQGATDTTASWTITRSATAGITSSISSGTVTVTAMTTDTGYIDITAARTGYTSITKRFTLAKTKAGAAGTVAKSLDVVPSSNIFPINKAGVGTISTITLVAQQQGLAGVPAWSIESGTATLTAGVDDYNKSIAYSSMTTDTVTILVTQDGINERVTITKLREGTDGSNGSAAVSAVLSNESHTIATDKDGNNGVFTGAVSNMKVYLGITDDTANWTFARTNGTGVTSTISTAGVLTVSGLTVDSSFVDVTASRSGYASITKRMSLAKARTGLTGATNLTADVIDSGWNHDTGASTVQTVTDGKVGSSVRRSSGTTSAEFTHSGYLQLDRSRTYRVRFWARAAAGTNGALFFDLRQYNASGVAGGNGGRAVYQPAGAAAHTDWREYSYTWTSVHFEAATTQVRPDFLLNYGGSAGYWEVQALQVQDITESVLIQKQVDDWASDNILSKGEKPAVILQWQSIDNEVSGLSNQADSLGVSKTAYLASKTALDNYLNGISGGWSTLTTDSPIVGTDFRTAFKNYATAKQDLINAMHAKNDNNQDSIIRAPGGALFTSQSSLIEGALQIRLPVSWTDTMMKFIVDIYEYVSGYSCSIEISGYNNTGALWYNCTARVLGGSNVEYPVRWGHDGTKCCVWIGETSGENGRWTYPQVRVRDFFAGYSSMSKMTWQSDWQISFVTSFGTVSQHVTDTLPGADFAKIPNKYGKPADNATRDITLVGRNVTVRGNTLIKTGGSTGDAWDGDAYSTDSSPFAYATATVAPANNTGIFFGLNDDPLEDMSYGDITFSWYFESTYAYATINFDTYGYPTPFSPGDVFLVTYDGVAARWYKNGVAVRQQLVDIGQVPLYFDSSFVRPNCTLLNCGFGPIAANLFDFIGGPNKPQNNATVGANTSNLNVGVGINMLSNSLPNTISDFTCPPGYTIEGGGPILAYRGHSFDTYSPLRQCGFTHVQHNPFPVNYIQDTYYRDGNKIPVKGGTRYEFSAFLSRHRCNASLTINWYTGDNPPAYISGVEGAYQVDQNSNTTNNLWTRVVVFADLPANARFCMVSIRMRGTGEDDPYVFYSGLHFGEALPSQTVASQWSDGAPPQLTSANVGSYIAPASLGSVQISDLRTTNYAEDGNGYPTAGAKLASAGTALKVASGSFQLGGNIFTDYWFRLFQAIDGSVGSGKVIWRGNNDSTTRGGAPDINRLSVYTKASHIINGNFQQVYHTYTITPSSYTGYTDNLDAMTQIHVQFFASTSSSSPFTEFYQPCPSRTYDGSTGVVSGSWHWGWRFGGTNASGSQVESSNLYSGALRIRLANCYGFSNAKDFGANLTVNGLLPATTITGNTAPPGGGGGGAGGGCPAPWVKVKLVNGKEVNAGDLHNGARVACVDDNTMAIIPEGGIVRDFAIKWSMRYQVRLANGKATEWSHDHRFAVEERGWVAVQNLLPGDRIIGLEECVVESIFATGDGQVVTYRVEGGGTYFAGNMLCHNIKYPDY